jgi:uncharacterized protein YegJ (DUF2314 family)
MNITEEQPNINNEVDRIANEIMKQKEGIFKKKLKELGYNDKFIEHLAKRNTWRFKKIMIVEDEVCEHFIIDNKTKEGQRVVSFYKPDPKIEGSELSMDIKYF